MKTKRAIRYLAPNIITATNLILGLLSLVASMEGEYVLASWLIIYAVMADRLDGLVARLVKGTSELGVQLDSFADFLNFGVAPGVLIYASLSRQESLPFSTGTGRVVLLSACGIWVLASVFRLARYNITSNEKLPPKVFFGVPTTLMGGVLVGWFLVLLK